MLELLIALAFGAIHSHVSVGPTCAFAWGGGLLIYLVHMMQQVKVFGRLYSNSNCLHFVQNRWLWKLISGLWLQPGSWYHCSLRDVWNIWMKIYNFALTYAYIISEWYCFQVTGYCRANHVCKAHFTYKMPCPSAKPFYSCTKSSHFSCLIPALDYYTL